MLSVKVTPCKSITNYDQGAEQEIPRIELSPPHDHRDLRRPNRGLKPCHAMSQHAPLPGSFATHPCSTSYAHQYARLAWVKSLFGFLFVIFYHVMSSQYCTSCTPYFEIGSKVRYTLNAEQGISFSSGRISVTLTMWQYSQIGLVGSSIRCECIRPTPYKLTQCLGRHLSSIRFDKRPRSIGKDVGYSFVFVSTDHVFRLGSCAVCLYCQWVDCVQHYSCICSRHRLRILRDFGAFRIWYPLPDRHRAPSWRDFTNAQLFCRCWQLCRVHSFERSVLRLQRYMVKCSYYSTMATDIRLSECIRCEIGQT